MGAQIPIPLDCIADFCRRYHIVEFSLFESVIRPDFRPDSVVDVLVVYESGHVERSKAEYVRGHLPSDLAFSRAVPGVTTLSQTFTRGDMAWVITEGRTTGTYEGKPVDRITTETLVLRLDAGGWRIVHIHWSSRKPPAAAS